MVKKVTKKKKIEKKKESIYEAVRHLGYYNQFNTCYKNVFGFAYLAQIMLFIGNLFAKNEIFGGIGVLLIIASVFYSYLSQQNFYQDLKKCGTLFQYVAIGFAGLSFICLCLSYFINII